VSTAARTDLREPERPGPVDAAGLADARGPADAGGPAGNPVALHDPRVNGSSPVVGPHSAEGTDPGERPLPAPVHPYPDFEVPLHYAVPTAEEFTTRRVVRPREWVATTGVRGAARRGTFGLVRMRPNRREREGRINLATVRRAFGGLRQITIVNPKGGAGKTVATLMLGLTFGQTRGGFVLAWDNNETQGTLGMRAQPDVHARTVRDLLRDLDRFARGNGRVGELAAYVRAQEDAAFDVLASDEAAAAGEMLTARAFRDLRDVVGRFYKLILVDTGNNVRAENWQAAVDATDQLVITMSARNDSAETAARLLDHLEQTGRRELVRRAVTVVTLPPHRKDVNPRAIERHFDQRCRAVLRVPYDRHLDSGAPVRYAALSPESRRAWLRVAAAVADGL
jgi:MinD-like ATPase involved in chromosome partitioning or flagellar assembly